MRDLLELEKRHGTAATLRACHAYIREHRREKAALAQVERGKGPKGSNRASTFKKAMREADNACSRSIRNSRPAVCEIHAKADELGIELKIQCGGRLQAYHIIPKSDRRGSVIRFDPENILVACSGINKWESHHRGDMEKIHEQLFPERMARLREKMKWPSVKRNEAMLRAMIAEFNKR